MCVCTYRLITMKSWLIYNLNWTLSSWNGFWSLNKNWFMRRAFIILLLKRGCYLVWHQINNKWFENDYFLEIKICLSIVPFCKSCNHALLGYQALLKARVTIKCRAEKHFQFAFCSPFVQNAKHVKQNCAEKTHKFLKSLNLLLTISPSYRQVLKLFYFENPNLNQMNFEY